MVLSVLIAVLMLFSAAKVGAACGPNLPPGWCFEHKGYKVEIVPDNEGNFPKIVGGNSVYTYRITRTTWIRKFRDVDILIPVCTRASGTQLPGLVDPPVCVGKFYKGGSGDPSTGFGSGLTTNDTWNWNMFSERNR